MAVSYRDYKDAVANSDVGTAVTAKTAELATASYLSGEIFTPCTDGRYERYTKYCDEAFSIVDSSKNVTVDKSQTNLTQETNSQYVPFKITRYWDGIDLMEMFIQFRYENKNGKGKLANAVNVAYNDEFITFGWLIDSNVTSEAGDVVFEIMATGVNEKGDSYVWRTKPNGKLTVLEALNYDGIIEPTDDWYTSFVNMVLAHVAEAKSYAENAKSSADSVDVNNIQNTVIATITPEITKKITLALEPYYDKTTVDGFISDINQTISGLDSLANLKVQYDNTTGALTFFDGEKELSKIVINSLSNLKVSYEVLNGKGILTFHNGESEITSVEIGNAEPSAQWASALRTAITEEIGTATSPLSSSISKAETAVTNLTKEIEKNKTAISGHSTEITSIKSDLSSTKETLAETTNTVSVVKSDVDGHTTEIQGLSTGLAEAEKKIAEMGTVKSNEYDVDYTENIFTLYENDEIKKQFTITGGGGGTVDSSSITIEYITANNAIVLAGDSALVKFRFTSVDNAGDTTGNGTAIWTVGNTKIATSTVTQGENTFDLTNYIKTGENRVKISITDSFGTIATKVWTITVVEFKIESIFDDSLFYSGEVTFRYTPYGNINKDIHFVLDGKEIAGLTSSISGRQMTQTLDAQSHGSHLLEVYMTTTINNQKVTSESVYKDILWVDPKEKTPIIGCSVYKFL